jgi:hypothetical protein
LNQLGHCPMGDNTKPGAKLNRTSIQRLLAYGAPFVLLQMASYMGEGRARDLDLVELFAGEGKLSAAFKLRGKAVCPYDIQGNPQLCNILTDTGFLHAVGLAPGLFNGRTRCVHRLHLKVVQNSTRWVR